MHQRPTSVHQELQALREARTLVLNHHRPVVAHPGHCDFTWTQTISALVANLDYRLPADRNGYQAALGPVLCEACNEPYPCPLADLLRNTLPVDDLEKYLTENS